MISETSRWLTGGLVYPQIADRLREKITSGEYPAGGALPSEAALVEEFHVARTTVRRGLAVLETPIALPRIEITQYWHERYHRDAAHRWFRSVTFELFGPAANARRPGEATK